MVHLRLLFSNNNAQKLRQTVKEDSRIAQYPIGTSVSVSRTGKCWKNENRFLAVAVLFPEPESKNRFSAVLGPEPKSGNRFPEALVPELNIKVKTAFQ